MRRILMVVLLAVLLVAGCTRPDAANVEGEKPPTYFDAAIQYNVTYAKNADDAVSFVEVAWTWTGYAPIEGGSWASTEWEGLWRVQPRGGGDLIVRVWGTEASASMVEGTGQMDLPSLGEWFEATRQAPTHARDPLVTVEAPTWARTAWVFIGPYESLGPHEGVYLMLDVANGTWHESALQRYVTIPSVVPTLVHAEQERDELGGGAYRASTRVFVDVPAARLMGADGRVR